MFLGGSDDFIIDEFISYEPAPNLFHYLNKFVDFSSGPRIVMSLAAEDTRNRWRGSSRVSAISRELRILQANMKRGKEAQHALHNDPALADFHFILGQELGCFLAEGEVVLHGTNPRWTSFVPSGRRQGQYPVRTCIWAASDVKATQIQADLDGHYGRGDARRREEADHCIRIHSRSVFVDED
jgi:hypothetical protein